MIVFVITFFMVRSRSRSKAAATCFQLDRKEEIRKKMGNIISKKNKTSPIHYVYKSLSPHTGQSL